MPAADVVRWTSLTNHDPASRLNLNDRTGWRAAARATAAWRKAAWALGFCNRPVIPVGMLAVVQVEFGTNRPNARRDPGNWAPVTKAVTDGLTDAKFWPDDDSRHVATLEPKFTTDIPHRHFRIHVEWRPQ